MLMVVGQHVNCSKFRRRILIDVGMNNYSSSLEWFDMKYPCEFDQIYAFEVEKEFITLPPYLSSQKAAKIKIANKFVSTVENSTHTRLATFIPSVATEDDFVVLKVDIESHEWQVFADMEVANSWRFVSELFVEMHYDSKEMYECCWLGRFNQSCSDAHALFKHLREDLQVYAHTWP